MSIENRRNSMKLDTILQPGTKFSSLLKPEEAEKYFGVFINGRVYDIEDSFDSSFQGRVQFLSIEDSQGAKCYEASLRYLIAMAVNLINPKLDVRFFYNISRSIFCKIFLGKNRYKVTPKFVSQVEALMKKIVEADLPLTRIRVSKEEALRRYKAYHLQDKIKILDYRTEDFVHLYRCEYQDKEYFDYLYAPLVSSTGILKKFSIRFYDPGFILQYPRSEFKGEIPEFKDESKFAFTLASSFKWAEINELDKISSINNFVKEYGELALINLCEARINNLLADLGEKIDNSPEKIRLICVAGPSSSGKTSFANRLLYELMSRGLRPIRISMDDFYIPRGELPKGADLESLEAIDVKLFNDDMMKLVAGEAVSLPHYDFKEAKRKFLKPIRVDENQPIIIEGIHALNSRLFPGIPQTAKFRVYIAPQPQVNIDNHTPVSMTDMRLLRRIARDARTRGSDAAETIRMWPNVRNGEFKYIYPTQENADFVFDSFCPYEPCAIRNIVLPQLKKIKVTDREYPVAQRLTSFIKYFLPINIADIPCNSLIREFVGGTCFKDAR